MRTSRLSFLIAVAALMAAASPARASAHTITADRTTRRQRTPDRTPIQRLDTRMTAEQRAWNEAVDRRKEEKKARAG